MATVFETRIIGNIGKDAVIKPMERGIIAINFPVAHNKNWRDKKTGSPKTKTTWVNCTTCNVQAKAHSCSLTFTIMFTKG